MPQTKMPTRALGWPTPEIGDIRETQEMRTFMRGTTLPRNVEVISIQEIQVYERRLENDMSNRFVIDLASLNSGAP